MRDFPRREVMSKGVAALAGLAAIAATSGSPVLAADTAGATDSGKNRPLKRFVIERDIPSIGMQTAQGYCDISRTSDDAVSKLAPHIQWEHSYIADNKTFCVYLAEDEAAIRRHGELSGFPVTKITAIDCIIDPTTASTKVPA